MSSTDPTDLPEFLQLPQDEPNDILRVLNNAYVVIDSRSDDEGPHDAVANVVLHEILRAREALASRSPAGEPAEPVAWRVHRKKRGEALYESSSDDKPALFQSSRSAISWMHEQIDFKGWRDAWIEPLYATPSPAAPSGLVDSTESAGEGMQPQDGSTETPAPKREYTMGDWFRDLDNPHGGR